MVAIRMRVVLAGAITINTPEISREKLDKDIAEAGGFDHFKQLMLDEWFAVCQSGGMQIDTIGSSIEIDVLDSASDSPVPPPPTEGETK